MSKEEKKESDEVVDSTRKQKDLEELKQMTSTGPRCDFQQLTEDAVVHSMLVQWEGHKNFKRVKAFQALQGERVYQESLHKKTGQETLSIAAEMLLMRAYLEKAEQAFVTTFGDPDEKPTMDVIRKVTAIGLRALETYGCPLRDIEGSLAARPSEHRAGSVEAKKLDAEKVLEERIKKYLDLLRYAPAAITKLDVRFARARQELLEDITTPSVEEVPLAEPTPPSTEDISEADVSPDITDEDVRRAQEGEDEGRTRNMGM